MARSRNIKPGFYTNEELAECSIWARFIFPGLWMLADREGRLEDRPKRIKGELLPFDPKDVDPLLNELEAHFFIIRYENDDGRFIQILKFNQHQSPHYSEKPSRIKPPKLQESAIDDGAPVPGITPPLRGGRNPLIPDSLIPDSLKETTPAISTGTTEPAQPPAGVPVQEVKAHVDKLRAGLPVGTPEHDAAAMLWATLHANGCKGTASHPTVIEMARQGVTVEALKRAISEARKTNEGPLNPKYLAAIIERQAAEKPGNGKAAAWATDEQACEAKARELGLWPARSGEDWNGLRSRIRAAITKRAEEATR